uniref:Uncharacterized protein n=1 Tax=Sphaerodactylus townsendi TaxID=933632 RepID=A0ACB8EY28_9SAUR
MTLPGGQAPPFGHPGSRFLFYFHVMSRPLLDQLIHSLLLIAIFGAAASVLLETFLRDNIVLELLRSSLALLQGTWLFQIGFVLFPPWGGPAWDANDHGNIMFLIMCFCWHYALAIVILAMNYAVAYRVVQKCCTNKGGTEIKLAKRKENEKSSRIALLKGSDED